MHLGSGEITDSITHADVEGSLPAGRRGLQSRLRIHWMKQVHLPCLFLTGALIL